VVVEKSTLSQEKRKTYAIIQNLQIFGEEHFFPVSNLKYSYFCENPVEIMKIQKSKVDSGLSPD